MMSPLGGKGSDFAGLPMTVWVSAAMSVALQGVVVIAGR
jgi:hypothetical protein